MVFILFYNNGMYKENILYYEGIYIIKIKIFFFILFLYIKLIDIILLGVSEMVEGMVEG